jgi:hypothetical protein
VVATGIEIGDRVRVSRAPETEAAGIAELVGQVYGFTMPSTTGIAALGDQGQDVAFNVSFEGRSESVWIAPHLLALVDHAPGTTIGIGARAYVRQPDGSWEPLLEPTAARQGWIASLKAFFGRQREGS